MQPPDTDTVEVGVADAPTNTAPVFTDGASATRAFSESIGNTGEAAARDVGNVVAATDADSDTITYSLGGTDAAKFQMATATGQIQTKADSVYSHEAAASLDVTVTANDGTDATTIAVTISVTDVDEPPLVPTITDVTNFAGSHTSLRIHWSAGNNAHRPAVTGWKMRWREVGTSTWDSIVFTPGTAEAGTIIGLTSGREYEIQGRAENAEGDGSYTASTNAHTTAPATGKPAISGTAQANRTLTASTSAIMDANGLANVSFTYQWRRLDADDSNETNIPGATSNTYQLTTAEVGKKVKVRVSFTDDAGFDEARTSDAYPTSGTITAASTTDATLSGLALEDASDDSGLTLSPGFASGTTSYTASVANGVDTVTVKPTVNESNATVAYLDGDDAAIADADGTKDDQQVALGVGANTIKVKVTAEDDVTTETYTVTVTRASESDGGICGRTLAVQTAILGKISGVIACADVTTAHLAAITGTLNLSSKSIAGLAAGDFAGLTALWRLQVNGNALTSLPAGVFDGLTALTILDLYDNALTSLSADVFDQLTKLEGLSLNGNALTGLSAGVFDALTELDKLDLNDNALTSLSAGVFDELTKLTSLTLNDNALTSLSRRRVRRADEAGGPDAGQQRPDVAAPRRVRPAEGAVRPDTDRQPRPRQRHQYAGFRAHRHGRGDPGDDLHRRGRCGA